jgi:hypothetical protein
LGPITAWIAPWLHRDAHAVERADPAEREPDVDELEHRLAARERAAMDRVQRVRAARWGAARQGAAR